MLAIACWQFRDQWFGMKESVPVEEIDWEPQIAISKELPELEVDSHLAAFTKDPNPEACAELLGNLYGIPAKATPQGMELTVQHKEQYGILAVNQKRVDGLKQQFMDQHKFLPDDFAKAAERAMNLTSHALRVKSWVEKPLEDDETFTPVRLDAAALFAKFDSCKDFMAQLERLNLMEETRPGAWKFTKAAQTKAVFESRFEIVFSEKPIETIEFVFTAVDPE